MLGLLIAAISDLPFPIFRSLTPTFLVNGPSAPRSGSTLLCHAACDPFQTSCRHRCGGVAHRLSGAAGRSSPEGALPSCWRDLTGSDWQPAAHAGWTIAGISFSRSKSAPHTARPISLAAESTFDPGERSVRLVGLLVAPVYRLKITGIRNREGQEVFPTLEIVDRTYPPLGQELRHPIPIEITAEDLELALEGKFVTRVVYIEDPRQALPHRSDGKAADGVRRGEV